MASCPSCGADTRQGDWTCRGCGSPLGSPATETTDYGEPVHDQDYYQAPTIYGTTAPSRTQPANAKAARGSTLSWLVPLTLVAVIGLVAVWFFVLRPAPGAQFLGTWHAQAVTASGTTDETLTIAKRGAAYTIAGALDGQPVGRQAATLKSGRLESDYPAPGVQVLQYKALHIVLTVDGATLAVVEEATTVSGATVPVGETERFTKAD